MARPPAPPPTDKEIAEAKKVLAKHKFTPGVSNTQNLKGADRDAVKDACQVLKRAGQVSPAPEAS